MGYQAFIFHTPHTRETVCGGALNSGQYTDSGYLYDGQIIFYVGMDKYYGGASLNQSAVIKWYDLVDKEWKISSAGGDTIWNTPTYKNYLSKDYNSLTDGAAVNITRMNDVYYGSAYYDSHCGGDHYTLRKTGWRTVPGSGSGQMLASTKGVAFGSGQGYSYGTNLNENSTLIRMYGYYEPNGHWVETNGNYLEVDLTEYPVNYCINTF